MEQVALSGGQSGSECVEYSKINKFYQHIKGKDIITTPKTRKSNRVLTLPDFLSDEMQDYIFRLPYLKVDDRIFTITKSGLHHEMDRGCRETGVKEYVSMI